MSLYLARSTSLREAADVLRTDRRSRRKERRALANANTGLLHKQKHYVPKYEPCVKNVLRRVQACGKTGGATTNDKKCGRKK